MYDEQGSMRMKESFFSRLTRKFFRYTFISYVGIIVLVFALVYFFTQNTIRKFYIENLTTHLIQVGYSLKPGITALYEADDLAGMDRLVKEVGKEVETRITVIAPDGRVMADSQKDPRLMENHKNRPEILDALKGKTLETTRYSATMHEQMLYVGLPVQKNNETEFVIRLSLYMSHVKQLIRELGWKFSAALPVLFLAALALAWYFSRSISKPVQEIAAATREFASGNFNARIFLEKRDELAEVADSFNNMVKVQASLFAKLSQNRAELQAIIASMKEGLLVLDANEKITLCNESFEEIIAKKNVLGSAYWEVIRIAGFEEFIKRGFEGDETFYEEVELGMKTFLVGFNPMKQGEKLVIIFRDITHFKQLEQMKKDFVVNLTHELKTPLTAIKGFIEALEEEENIKNTQYVEIIKRHTDRMNLIVSDLLTLSELEDNKREVVFEPLDLEEITTNILKIYREKIKEKNLELELNIEKNLPGIDGEIFKMEQLLINLVDNAVKYTEEGKIAVIIGKSEDNRMINIQVKNTGLPIPEKSLPRIFERFYVVDKSRSRKLGGTGLGLSIVKHVALLHKGEISVESTKEKGTVFTIKLPVC
ncbi:MAG: ATP-binding protein [Candidatus Aminicenantes bacterium]|nr:ATP-binding protein [Candidatus Aminicenantes bacterium]